METTAPAAAWKPQRRLFGNAVKLVLADNFLYMLEMCKMVWFGGRFGGGKTSGAYIIASWLYAHNKVDRIMSNVPDKISSPVRSPINKTAMIIDESWQFLAGWDDVQAYAAYLRKLELILLMPSVFPPNPRLRMLTVNRVWDGYTVGFPLWVYKYNMSVAGVREKGTFIILNPAACFGLFDTKFIPTNDNGIVDAIEKTVVDMGGVLKGKRAKNGPVKKNPAADLAATVDDASSAFSTGAELLAEKIKRVR